MKPGLFSQNMQRAANHGWWRRWLTCLTLFVVCGAGLRSQTATGISGLYFTGVNDSGALRAKGSTETHWDVTYTSANGGQTANTTNRDAYVVNTDNPAGIGWHANTANARWITAPGGTGTGNAYLAGIGNNYTTGSGTSNMGIYIYTLAFTITGAAGSQVGDVVTNNVSIGVTMAADDQYKIYVNPVGNGASIPSGTPAAIALSAWVNQTQFTLSNYSDSSKGIAQNSVFKIGVNYLVIEVDNTDSKTGYVATQNNNATGLLFYQQGQNVVIGNNTFNLIGGSAGTPGVVPEVGTWLPAVGVLGLLGGALWRRRLSAVAGCS